MTQSIKRAFSAGILSPDIDASTELEKYPYGLKECTNMIINPLGGVKNRPGTEYIADAYNTAQLSRFIPFQFNTVQSYVLEFGNLKMRIIKDGAMVGGGSPTEIVTPYAIADVADLEFTQSADTLYVFHPNYKIRAITRTSDTAWTIFALGKTAVTSDHNGPYRKQEYDDKDIRIEVLFDATPSPHWDITASSSIFGDIEVDDVIKLGFPVTGDPSAVRWVYFEAEGTGTTTFVAQNIDVGEGTVFYEQIQNHDFKDGLTFWGEHSDTNSKISHDFTNKRLIMTDGASGDAKTEQVVLVQSQVSHILTLNLSALTGTAPQITLKVGTTSFGSDILAPTVITSTGVTRYDIVPTAETIYISIDTTGSTDGDVAEISSVSLVVTEAYKVAGIANPVFYTSNWRLPIWNSTNGFPENGIINGDRLIPANTAEFPQTLWPSVLADYVRFSSSIPGVDTDSFSFNPSTTQINGIEWMVEHNGLKIGASDGIWSVFSSTGGVITPTDVNVKIDSGDGSLPLKPLIVSDSLIMTPRGISAVAELTQSTESQGYVSKDLSILAGHLFKDRRIVRWAYAREPDSVIWCILDDGTLLGLTYAKEYDMWAWHKHSTPLGVGFADIAVIPNSSDDNIDDVYFIINRAEDGDTPNYYIEILNKRITSQTAAFGLSASGTPYDYKFLDSASTWDVSTSITGATSANPVVITDTAHGYDDGDFIRIQNVKGMKKLVDDEYVPALNNNVYKIANKTANTYDLNNADDSTVDGTGFTTYLAGGESRKMVTTILSGLDHLEGETVSALADGVVETGLVVSSGSITLSDSASFVHVGLPYTSEIETLDIELMGDTGSTQGRLKSMTDATVYFKDTRTAEIAAGSRDNWQEIPFNSEAYGEDPPPLFNGTKEKRVSGNPTKQETCKIRNGGPLPLYIKRIVINAEFNG